MSSHGVRDAPLLMPWINVSSIWWTGRNKSTILPSWFDTQQGLQTPPGNMIWGMVFLWLLSLSILRWNWRRKWGSKLWTTLGVPPFWVWFYISWGASFRAGGLNTLCSCFWQFFSSAICWECFEWPSQAEVRTYWSQGWPSRGEGAERQTPWRSPCASFCPLHQVHPSCSLKHPCTLFL